MQGCVSRPSGAGHQNSSASIGRAGDGSRAGSYPCRSAHSACNTLHATNPAAPHAPQSAHRGTAMRLPLGSGRRKRGEMVWPMVGAATATPLAGAACSSTRKART